MTITTSSMQEKKNNRTKITMLTAYDYSTAKLMDSCGVDSLLVGDSLGMVMLGYKDTLPVTMEDMIHHARAVVRGCENAMVVVDMPFMSYQVTVEQAVANAGRLIKETGACCVKLEGGSDVSAQIQAITKASIPVMGHIGLTPQSINAFGGYKVQGKSREHAEKLIADAQAVEKAGAFAVVIECVPAALAALISQMLTIPTIGIGAGPDCDGQVLVYHDMLSLYSGKKAKFVKEYADIGTAMSAAFRSYIEETKSGVFPGPEHGYSIDGDLIKQLRQAYGR